MLKGSWKTTLTGILTIAGAVVAAGLQYLKTGTLPEFGPLIAAVTAGVGLIAARDNNKSSEEVGAK